MIERRPERNPLNAEKSPRTDFTGFVFKPPESTIVEKPKWNYSDSDWGLMAQFRSQKDIYEQIYDRERRQKERECEVEQIKKENTYKIEEEIKRRRDKYDASRKAVEEEEQKFRKLDAILESPDQDTAKHHHFSQHHQHHQENKRTIIDPELLRLDNDDEGSRKTNSKFTKSNNHNRTLSSSSSSSLIPMTAKPSKIGNVHDLEILNQTLASSSSSLKSNKKTQSMMKQSLKQYEKSLITSHPKLTTFGASSLKELQTLAPEVMQEYRLERAKQFINNQGENALYPPQSSSMLLGGGASSTTAFRPAGIAIVTKPPQQHEQHTTTKTNRNNNNANIPVAYLQAELNKTEEAYSRQKLLISLQNSRTKSYMMNPSSTSSASR